jgi:amino acid adenylation domain-containing protein
MSVTDLTARTEELSPKQRRLLELMLRQKRKEADAPAPAAIPRRRPDDPLVLSFGQKRLWFIEQLQPGSPAYHVPGAVRIRGPLDVAVLEAALQGVARRHEILRTSFPVVDGQPALRIDEEPGLELEMVDLRRVPDRRREAELARQVSARVLQPFDLAKPPLARTALFRLGEEEHVFLLILQHIVCDIWSVGVFFRTTMALYDAFAGGRLSPLPELPLQYTDYALWQERLLQGEGLERLLGYWKGQLVGAPFVIDLPADHPRPPIQSFEGSRRYMNMGVELTEALKAAAKERDASLYMILLAALYTLLFRYTGQETVLVGVPMANRGRVELEGLIGLLFNSLVLRADMAPEMPFRELLGQVRERTLGAFNHQDLPFEKLVEDLRVERDMSRNPIYQVLFAFQNVPPSAMKAHGLELARYEVSETASREDLELDLRETPEGLAGWFGYDLALFDATTVTRATLHFQNLLAGIVADPERPLADLPLLTPPEAQELLLEWNDRAVEDADESFEDLLAARAAETPEAPAAVFQGRSETYRELTARADRLARHLSGMGVVPNSVVALLDRRGPDLLAGILGTLGAGGAWLPLDPDHPARRHAQVLETSGAPLALASDELRHLLDEAAGMLPEGRRPKILSLPALLARQAPEGGPPLSPGEARADDLAYTIFTSGSTGVPKGAMVTRRGMLNHLRAKIEDLGLTAADAVAQTASQCFDISVWQLLAALAVGGRVHIYDDDVAHDPARLLAAVDADGVTVLETVPSLLRLMVDGPDRPALPSLRWMIPTGEALPPELASRWLAAWPTAPMVNAYGPTECSDDVTHQLLDRPVPEGLARVPIGRPIRNTRLYVVDRSLRPVPAGVAGELCVGGAGVGRGYLNAPEKTAAVFVPDPFAEEPGSRLYRTGDLARRLADGALDFLGRIDHQVKVRGFRIELGEIEAVLSQHPAVRQAVVLVQEAALVAYLIADGDADLRPFLTDRLPEYMVPAAFVTLEAFPLTPNGKIDRKALLALGGASFAPRVEYVAPRTPVEESLAGIWAEVLKVPRVGVHDNFFEIGGQSLLATQVVSRIREVFQAELPVRVMFQRPQVGALAEAVEEAMLAGRGLPPVPPIVPVPRDGELPLSFSQERLWFIDRLRPGITAYNIFGAVRLRGGLDVAVLGLCFDELLRRHEVLRTTFAEAGGRPVQVPHPPSGFTVPLVDLSALPDAARGPLGRRLGNEEARRPFDLGTGPLLRGVLIRVDPRDHLLALTAHHIVYDVWSRELLVRELGVLYEAFWHGRPPSQAALPALPVQYADFAFWQRHFLTGDVLAAQLQYWKRQLKGMTGGSELPGDRPRPAVQSFRGARALFELPPALTASLAGLARRQGATLFMTLLAGFYAFLHRVTGDDDVAVGTPIANRNRAETEGLIGFFVNTLVFRVDLRGAGGDPTFHEMLARTRETALGGYSHQDLAFEQLVNELKPRRDTSRQPMFQILFNFLTNYRPVVMELPGLVLSPEPNHSGATQFDLILSMYESEGSLHFSADYSTDLYDAATMARFLGSYAGLLAGAAAHPEGRLSELPLSPEAERQQVLREWNDTETGGSEALIHQLFAAQAERTPGAEAVAFGDERLTYGQLHRRSDRLALRLRALGVGPESRVGVHLERSPEMVIALLAVLKAGGGYVPLDPGYPGERLAHMLADSGARVLVTQPRLSGKLAGRLAGAEEVVVDGSWDDGPVDLPPAPTAPDNLAYVIYTSGSTGRPKGVLVSHRSLVASTLARLSCYPEVPSAFLLLSSFAFDSSVAGIFGTLCGGGRLVVTPAGLAEDADRLGEVLRREGISHLLCVPSLYAHLVERPELAAVRGVTVAGEACPAELVERHFALHPGAGLWNEYGPTEGTVWSSVHAFAPGRPERVPIGRPVAGVRLYVVDGRGLPAPLGVPGELWIGGAGVARGYHGRPDLTAERFIPDPFGGAPGARLYRTGDLVRWLADGELQFLGRIDQQVKVRGFRIELEEIEAVLRTHRAVHDAVVVPLAAARGERREAAAGAPQYQRLAAYVVVRPGEPEPQAAALRAYLKERLPEYMVPTGFLPVPALPLTPNGKVDRRALAAADGDRFAPEVAYVAPRTPVESRLAEIWRELLEVERVGVDDNFFDLGGHSLLTTRLVSRIRDAFQLEVPLQTFFEEPTVAGVAQSIELARWAEEVAQTAPAGVVAEGFEEGEL